MDAIETARSYLPLWVGWLSLVVIPVSLVISLVTVAVTSWFAMRPVKELSQASHWTVQAAVLFPAVKSAQRLFFVLPLLCGLVAGLLYGTPFSVLSAGNLGVVTACAVLAVSVLPTLWLQRRVLALRGGGSDGAKDDEGEESQDLTEQPRESALELPGYGTVVRAILSQLFFSFVVLVPQVLCGGLVVAAYPTDLGLGHTVAVMVCGLLLVLFLMGGSTKLAVTVGLATPADDRLKEIVRETREKMEIELDVEAFVLKSAMANAFALPFARQMLFTEAILENLSDDELKAVCAHELGHITEPPKALAKRFVMLLVVFLFLAFVGPVAASGSIIALAALFCLVLFPIVLLRRFGREMEERADDVGLTHEGAEGTYARALETLYRVNLMPAVMSSKNTTHPHLYDRLLQAGMEPSYLRPEPPSRTQNILNGAVFAFCVMILHICALVFVNFLPNVYDPPTSTNLSLALRSDPSWELTNLALESFREGRVEEARDFYQASASLRESPYVHANLAITHVHLQSCAQAKDHAQAAQQMLPSNAKPSLIDLVSDAMAAADACAPPQDTQTPPTATEGM